MSMCRPSVKTVKFNHPIILFSKWFVMVVSVKTHQPNIQSFVLLMSEYRYLQSAKQKTILWTMENIFVFYGH